jgi:Flp pilus assembly pilin Flp
MKTYMKKLVRDEKGAALVLALILLLIGGLISAALLGHMGAGLLAGEVYGRRTTELYAADAGVEGAIWKIQNKDGYLPCSPGSPDRNYTITDVNGKNVGLTIECVNSETDSITYKITSIAITDGDGSGGIAAIDSATAVEAYLSVSYMDLSNLLDNAIVSDTFIGIKNNVYVSGNVTSGGEVQCWGAGGCEDIVDGTVTDNAELDWPAADDLMTYYMDDVEDLDPPFPYTDPLNVAGAYIPLGALYRDGPWTIFDGSNDGGMVTLSGTVYVTGDLEVGTQKQDFTLNLNGQTIFVASDSTGSGNEALQIGDKCTIVGSGCIISVGDLYFAPKGDVGSEDEFVLVMSVDGATTLQPSGTFYGCVAGDLSVDVQSGHNATIIHTAPEGKGLNVPWGVGDDEELPPVTGLSIKSWEVKQQ